LAPDCDWTSYPNQVIGQSTNVSLSITLFAWAAFQLQNSVFQHKPNFIALSQWFSRTVVVYIWIISQSAHVCRHNQVLVLSVYMQR
jgi:hypothetical protein